jgi:hypothetical protein|eukprot:COSAG06_NODE_838_length_12005_cov_473.630354_10_plen_173_part_00
MSGADDSNSMAAIAAMTTVGIPRLDLESPSLGGSPRPAIGGDSAPSSASGGSSSVFSSPFSAAVEDLGTPLSAHGGGRSSSGSPGPTSPQRSARESIRLAAQSSHKKGVHHHVLSPREEEIMNSFEALDYDVIGPETPFYWVAVFVLNRPLSPDRLGTNIEKVEQKAFLCRE